VDFYSDIGVQMAPSPVFSLLFTLLTCQAAIFIVLLPQVTAISLVFLPVIYMVIAAVSIVVPPVMLMVIVVGLYGHDRDKQGGTQ
jgi:hypothetical protein